MPVKRSRIGRSSSFGETDLFNRLTSLTDSVPIRRPEVRGNASAAVTAAAASPSSVAVDNPAKLMKPSSAPQRTVLTLSSPEPECADKRDQKQIQGFLEKCYFCRKKIRENTEVYMYSYLRAFCTAECRAIHISMDKEMEKKKSEKMDGVQHG